MGEIMKKASVYLLLICLLSSCSLKYNYEVNPYDVMGVIDENSEYIPALNSFVKLQMYNENELKEVRSSFSSAIQKVHIISDSYHSYFGNNNVKTINENYGKEAINVDPLLIDLVNKGIELTKLTKGIFNITMGQTISLWSNAFNNIDNSLTADDPNHEEIGKSLTSIINYEEIDNYIKIDQENSTIKIENKEDALMPVLLNFGGISKGFALDQVNDLFLNNQPGIISAGSSSISLKGTFPLSNRKYYLINIREPSFYKSSQQEVFLQLALEKYTNISNSGDYEKFFFTKDTNTLRSHIINASTGFSDNYHRTAIVFSDTYSYVLDVLSTTLMNLETIDEIKEMVKRFEDFYKTSIAYCIIDDFENGFKLSVNEKFNECIVENKISSIIKDIQVIKN